MIIHYLKVAVRNLLKYKTQSVISILGLAVGFVCFALSAMWIRHEMTYDTHLEGHDRMYVLYRPSVTDKWGYSTMSSYPMSTVLKRDFPEVEATCALIYWKDPTVKTKEGETFITPIVVADSCFMNLFQIRIAEGSADYMYSNNKVAVTEEFSTKVFGHTDVLGKEIELQSQKKTICALLDGVSPHSNFNFGYWTDGEYFRHFYDDWGNSAYVTVIKLHEGTNLDDFLRKMKEYEAPVPADWKDKRIFKNYMLMPLTEYHYADFNNDKSMYFNYLILFVAIGTLVILCSLFNYLSLFVVRVRTRLREITLRRVYGARLGQLVGMFLVEYLPIIFMSGFVGMMIVELIFPLFRKVSKVTGGVYQEPGIYFGVVALVSILILLPVLWMSPRLTAKRSNNRFRKASVFCQLVISLFFVFCVSAIMKQVHYLKHTDLGWQRENVAAFNYLYPTTNVDAIVDKIKQMPSVKEVMTGHTGLLPKNMSMSIGIQEWEGKPDGVEHVSIEVMNEGKSVFDFYGLQLVEGRLWDAEESAEGVTDAVINESAVKALGLHDPIGQQITGTDKTMYHIIGVVKDFHTTPPTVPVAPLMFCGENGWGNVIPNRARGSIILKFHSGQWEELEKGVNELLTSEYPEVNYKFVNVEEFYNKYLGAEELLMNLLGVVSVVCMLICAFGVFSLVSLTCRQRQKEIAIRKVNGATVKDILRMFAREYFILLTVSSAVAFTAGYAVMKHWLESYTLQTPLSAWLFIVLYLAAALIIALCIGWRVWRAANENPATIIRKE
ncbi:MAG: ABC transporter permease [Bacteroides sp.]|nr:ABC transporter permease [Bacteroides sp.]